LKYIYQRIIIKREQTIDHIRESSKKTIQYIEEDVTNSDDSKTKSPNSDKMNKHNKMLLKYNYTRRLICFHAFNI